MIALARCEELTAKRFARMGEGPWGRRSRLARAFRPPTRRDGARKHVDGRDKPGHDAGRQAARTVRFPHRHSPSVIAGLVPSHPRLFFLITRRGAWRGHMRVLAQRQGAAPLPPHLMRDLDDLAELRPLRLLGEDVALLGGGEAALRGEAELVERREFGRLVDAALDVVFPLERPGLRGDQAEDDAFVALGQEAERLEAAGALGVVFEEIAVDGEPAEQRLGHRLVAAGGNPGRAEIAAADMHGDRQVGRPAVERGIDRPGIALLQPVDVVAARARLLQLAVVAEIGPHGVVELQVAAAGIVEGADRLPVSGGRVGEELVDVRIDRLDGVIAETEVEHARAGDGHLRHQAGMRLEEPEVLEHRVIVRPAELAGDGDALRLGLHAVELDAVVELDQLAALEMRQEIEMPPGPAELAVGRRLEADLFLPRDDLLDLAVFDFAQRLRGDLTGGEFGARLLERSGAEQAADHVGAEGRFLALHAAYLPQPLFDRTRLRSTGSDPARHPGEKPGSIAPTQQCH